VVGYTDYAFKKFFEAAKKTSWFKNTIFVITADHCNQTYYSFYNQVINRQAIPILLYKPDERIKGVNKEFAQQIDIYPTLLDLIGYHKPFRSWGRSLFSEKVIQPFVFNYNGNQYQFMQGNYICTFDGKNCTGVFNANDYGLENNLITKLSNKQIDDLKISAKAFLQDYMARIIDKKMDVK
jgi:phosphoglycerol transferase MdoB-like AlkP superfamily enzyme